MGPTGEEERKNGIEDNLEGAPSFTISGNLMPEHGAQLARKARQIRRLASVAPFHWWRRRFKGSGVKGRMSTGEGRCGHGHMMECACPSVGERKFGHGHALLL